MEWNEAIENYKTYLVLEKSLSENSVEAYMNDIRRLSDFCRETANADTVEEITYNLLLEFIEHLNNGEETTTNRSQARCISSIRSFFRFLVYDGTLEKNPAKLLETPKIGRKLPTILTIDEIDSILKAVEMYKPEGQRNRAIIETLFSCGLRVSELIDIKMSNMDLRKNFLKIEGKGNKERILPISNTAKKEIKLYLKGYRSYLDIAPGNEDVLFLNRQGRALSRVMVFNIIKHLTLRAGINKRVSPHTFRHSFASYLVNGGADLRAVQDMLGHESILTTEIYTHLNNTFLKDTVNEHHPRALKAEAITQKKEKLDELVPKLTEKKPSKKRKKKTDENTDGNTDSINNEKPRKKPGRKPGRKPIQATDNVGVSENNKKEEKRKKLTKKQAEKIAVKKTGRKGRKPKREKTVKAEEQPKRKPGRPRKIVEPVASPIIETPKKRRGGRRKKTITAFIDEETGEVVEINDMGNTHTTEEMPKVLRKPGRKGRKPGRKPIQKTGVKRGRKRKEEPQMEATAEVEAKPKRRPGRPRKNAAAVASNTPEPQPKRRRGRPKKQA